jgi:hypothetical protein
MENTNSPLQIPAAYFYKEIFFFYCERYTEQIIREHSTFLFILKKIVNTISTLI